jgi:hypothetical protein
VAVFRIAAAAGLLLVLAPEQTRQAIASIFRGAEEARQAAPTKEQAAEIALSFCRQNPETCARAVRKAAVAEKPARP